MSATGTNLSDALGTIVAQRHSCRGFLPDPVPREQIEGIFFGNCLAGLVTGQGLPKYGTQVLMNVINEIGAMPTRPRTGEPGASKRSIA